MNFFKPLPPNLQGPAMAVVGLVLVIIGAVILFGYAVGDIKEAMQDKGNIKTKPLGMGVIKALVGLLIGVGGPAYLIMTTQSVQNWVGL